MLGGDMMDTKLYAKGFATACHAALLVCVLLISPFAVNASEITGLSLEKSAEGDVLSISSDGELDYQSFDLSAPARLVLTFPAATFSKKVEAIAGGESGVGNVSTSVTKTGARLDITLSKALTYKVEQQEKSLVLRFSPISGSQMKAVQESAVLKDISIADQGDVTELVVRGEHMNASHDAFVTNHGRTLIMDFWGAESMLSKEHFSAATQKVQSVTVGEAKGRVRLVVNLLPGVSDKHQIDATASQMIVRFGSVAAKRKAAVVQVEQVLFKPNDRISQMVIRTNVSNPVVSLHEEKGAAILDIKKAALAKGQERSQNVSDFPGPLSQIDAYKAGDKVRIVARLRDKVEISSFQQGNVLTVTFVPKDIASAKRGSTKGDAFEYTGQKVSFDYQGIDIRNALRLISEMSDMNIIMGEDVQGKLTMRLENVPWDQALDIILTSQGLGKEVQGNVMRIAPLPVLTKERQSTMEARQSEVDLAVLVTEFISLSYAKAADVKTMLENVKASGSDTASAASDASAASAAPSASGMLSARGSFVVDGRTNTLIVKDTQASVDSIKRLITQIDKPVRQVQIEARIVEASDSFTRDMGVRWGGQVSGKGGRVTNQVSNNTTTPGGFLIDLPAATAAASGGTVGIAIGAINNAFNLNLELSAAEADGDAKIVSNPRVVTQSGKQARIEQGTLFPATVLTVGTTTQNIPATDAKLSLVVTPNVLPNDTVDLNVLVTKNAPNGNLVNNAPVIDTKEVESNFLVKNGETIVIGGIYTRTTSKLDNGVPGLSKIPLLGWLFKKQNAVDNKTELLIFITPTIIESKAFNKDGIVQQL